jgi:tRNA nucleotidyltransferase/poly(A) polymerase
MIRLGGFEQRLFASIRSAAQASNTTVRVAGGWVRDSLLGITDSKDIDFVVNKSPRDLIQALKSQEHVSGVGTVHTNPEKGKNIEVETCHVMGRAIDVVMLREGDPAADAELRDFTINALFYNLEKECVEDFTRDSVGIKDLLENRVIRTPIDAKKTLGEDPIRIVRAARFAAKLDFKVHEDIVQAAKVKDIKDKLRLMSRERFGLEVNKALEGDRIFDFMRYLVDWEISGIVFDAPAPYSVGNLVIPAHLKAERYVDQICLESFRKFLEWKNIKGFKDFPPDLESEYRKTLLLASYLMPMRDFLYPQKSKKTRSTPWGIVAQGLKLPHKLADSIELLHISSGRFYNIFMNCLYSGDLSLLESNRLEIGQILRQIGAAWRDSALLAALSACENFAEVAKLLNSLDLFIESAELTDIWEWQPPISGDSLKTEFRYNGKEVGLKLEAQWRLRIRKGNQAKLEDYIESCSSQS